MRFITISTHQTVTQSHGANDAVALPPGVFVTSGDPRRGVQNVAGGSSDVIVHGTVLGPADIGKGNDGFTDSGPDGQVVLCVGSGTLFRDGFAIAGLDARDVILGRGLAARACPVLMVRHTGGPR